MALAPGVLRPARCPVSCSAGEATVDREVGSAVGDGARLGLTGVWGARSRSAGELRARPGRQGVFHAFSTHGLPSGSRERPGGAPSQVQARVHSVSRSLGFTREHETQLFKDQQGDRTPHPSPAGAPRPLRGRSLPWDPHLGSVRPASLPAASGPNVHTLY